jgi:acyl carrier protein
MDEINSMLAKIFKIQASEAEKDLTMNEVPAWDSLTHMDLIATIENTFNIQLSGDDIADMLSFDAIRQTVNKYRNP